MPNIMEISGLLGRGMGRVGRTAGSPWNATSIMDLRSALGAKRGKRRKKRSKKAKVRRVVHAQKISRKRYARPLPGPSAERMLEIAEAMYAKSNKALALAWGSRALKRAKLEGKGDVATRANELIKQIRGEAMLKTAAGLNDVEVIHLGRMLGLI